MICRFADALHKHSGDFDAGRGSDERGAVLLRRRRGADRGEPSAAGDPRRLTDAAWLNSTEVFGALRGDRASLDCAGAPSASFAAAAFYSIRSERQLVERLEFDMLFRWFVGLAIDETVWDASTFSKNRDRLLDGDIAQSFCLRSWPAGGEGASQHRTFFGRRDFARGLGVDEELPAQERLGRRRGRRASRREPRGRLPRPERSNETHASTTDQDARLYRKGPGQEAKLCFMGHALMENRNGLVGRRL